MYPRHNYIPVPKKIESLYQGRIRQFDQPGGEYGHLNLAAFYDRERTNSDECVKLEVYSVPDLARPSFKEMLRDAEWHSASIGDNFGPSWSTHWFKVQVKVPDNWTTQQESILFDWDSGDEGFIYTENGDPLVGLSAEHNRREWELPSEWADHNWHTFYVETSCNNIMGNNTPPDPNRYFRLSKADLVIPRTAARALHLDFWIVGDATREFPGSSWQKHKALDVCNRIINTFDRDNVDASVAKCREIAQEYLGSKVDSPQVYSRPPPPSAPTNVRSATVYAIGNCHIDTAWLWPFAETHRKIARSWASQLDLIEKYPEYHFAASQAQQFAWLLQDHPGLFDEIRKAAAKGRFIPIGGAWVECDTNMPSGESLARQLFLGQKFFQKHFNILSKVFWLPDTFGYAPQVPQLCRLAGMDCFLTQKLSWNNINIFPNTTFNWVGLDGSTVLCHMPPANTYTAQAHFGDVKRSLEQHKNLDVDQHAMLLFGHGDGGGGPTAEMLEKLRRCRGLTDTVGELPRVHQGFSVNDFFEDVMKSTDNGQRLVSWVGELYLEYHRGTYTTQAAIKKGNRYSEVLLHDIELLASAASVVDGGYQYPFDEIEKLWQDVCLNQFHDVLPGSGISMIYDDAREIYASVKKRGLQLLDGALKALGTARSDKHTGETATLNTLLWSRNDTTPAKVTSLSLSRDDKPRHVLENTKFKVTLEDGILVSVWDKSAQRQVLAENSRGNRLVLFEDQPLNFPAWDTEIYAIEKGTYLDPVKITADDEQVTTHYEFGKSTATVKTILRPSWIEFSVESDWHESYQFLKTEFPVDVRSTEASYETSFGYQKRPTNCNTSWETAKFEVCAHKYADLSDWSYGVALLNDCKYGYSIHGNLMRLSLLRSPKSPDPNADMGHHAFKYALMPHKGALSGAVVRAAYEFNHNTYIVSKSPKFNPKHPFGLSSNDENVFVSSVKRAASDRDGGKTKRIIIRFYEALGGKAKGQITSSLPLKRASKVNLLEEAGEEVDVLSGRDNDVVPFSLNPFEVQTICLELS